MPFAKPGMLIPWTFSSYSTFPPNILHIPNILDSPPCLQRFFFFHFVCCSITSVYNSAWHTVRSQYRFVKLISGSIRGELSLSQCRRSKRRGHNRLNTRFRPSDAALDLTQPEDSPCLNLCGYPFELKSRTVYLLTCILPREGRATFPACRGV